jgi:hypothetical protein
MRGRRVPRGRLVVRVTCDVPGCTAADELPVYLATESGCSPFGGPMCKPIAELDDDRGWVELPDRIVCPACWEAGRA